MTDLETQAVPEVTASLAALALMDEIVVDFPCFMDTVPEGEE